MDSQPQESLEFDTGLWHTLCVCCFPDSKRAKYWIHSLVPRKSNGNFAKWSDGRGTKPKYTRRVQFIDQIFKTYDGMDFSVHCISSTEADISKYAQYYYEKNITTTSQEQDTKGVNNLVFTVPGVGPVRIQVLRAAKLIWIYHCLDYLKQKINLNGIIYSDWFSNDSYTTTYPALGVSFVNYLLNTTNKNAEIRISKDPGMSEADLLSDWFAGWANSSKNGKVQPYIAAKFEEVICLSQNKIDWENLTFMDF
jgi:hypothetical protein